MKTQTRWHQVKAPTPWRPKPGVSGTVLSNLFALVPVGAKVKVKFMDTVISPQNDHEYKDYQLFTEEAVEFKLVGAA